MERKPLNIILTVIAAILGVTVIAAFVIIIPGKISEYKEEQSKDPYKIPLTQTVSNEGLSEFEQGLLNRDFSHDLDADRVPDAGETKLIQLQNRERVNDKWVYGLWTYRAIIDDVGGFCANFTETKSLSCSVNGKSADMTGKTGYMYNYKEVSIVLTFLENNETAVKRINAYGSGEYIPAVYAVPDSGKLVEAAYIFRIHSGGELAEDNEIIVVHVVDEDYARSERYRENAYANLIDGYEYVNSAKTSQQ